MDIQPQARGDDGGRGSGFSISRTPVRPLEGRSRVKVEPGRTLREVIEAADGHDLVVKAAGKPTLRWLGAVAAEDRALLRNCPCPVWIIRKPQYSRGRRVLAAVDFFDDAKTEALQTAAVTAHAIAVAELREAELDVVHAWQIPHELELRGRMNVTSLMNDMEKAHRKYLRRLLDEAECRRAREYSINGSANEVIPRVAEDRRVDLVVVANPPRTGLARLSGIRPAEQLLARLGCSIFVITEDAVHRSAAHARRSRVPERARHPVARTAHA